VPLGKRLAGFVRAGLFYALWYPTRWLGWSWWPKHAGFGRLAGHLRYVEGTARRLARQQFHLMVRYGPALEKRQAQLFRCVDIGAELFAMAAICARARADVARQGSDRTPETLADVFCRQSRMNVENLFEAIRTNADVPAYRAARDVLEGRYAWLESGIVEPDEAPKPVARETRGAAVGR
jgi:hypothetical protein